MYIFKYFLTICALKILCGCHSAPLFGISAGAATIVDHQFALVIKCQVPRPWWHNGFVVDSAIGRLLGAGVVLHGRG